MVMKNAFCSATALHGSVALTFFIPSAAEGSAVLRTIPGNVFRQRNHGPFGPPKMMKNAFYPATALHGSIALPFFIPSAAEGSAVQYFGPNEFVIPTVFSWRPPHAIG
jgi:hypothetical protein